MAWHAQSAAMTSSGHYGSQVVTMAMTTDVSGLHMQDLFKINLVISHPFGPYSIA